MKLSDFDYDLPQEYIAQTPLEKRDHSKLLVYNRVTQKHEIRHFYDIADYLNPGDVLVLNNTRVMPARLVGKKISTGADIEILLLKKRGIDTYEVLVKPLKRLRTGDSVVLGENVSAALLSKNEQDGTAVMRFFTAGKEIFENVLERIGTAPLPHYITEKLKNSERYQTVYNRISGSSAAPTAGLHWTPELLEKVKNKGVIVAEVLLHVGLGTFRPVKVENITEHNMHSEYYEISAESAAIIKKAKSENRRVICVGTTSLRTLEGSFAKHNRFCADRGETNIFIYPPYKSHVADALITNFHLPKSTLLMLVSAFVGREKILELYEIAKKNRFRFFSFGDSMLLC